MKRVYPYLKNKYIVSSTFVLLYILILHNTDVFTLINSSKQVSAHEVSITKKKNEIEKLKIALSDLDNPRSLEKYAREHHYFKKDDEDLFIFSFE